MSLVGCFPRWRQFVWIADVSVRRDHLEFIEPLLNVNTCIEVATYIENIDGCPLTVTDSIELA